MDPCYDAITLVQYLISVDVETFTHWLPLVQLIATAALFLAAKSEETPRPLNNVLRASSEIFHKQDINFLSYLLPVVSIPGFWNFLLLINSA